MTKKQWDVILKNLDDFEKRAEQDMKNANPAVFSSKSIKK
jgi:hypothetical protein